MKGSKKRKADTTQSNDQEDHRAIAAAHHRRVSNDARTERLAIREKVLEEQRVMKLVSDFIANEILHQQTLTTQSSNAASSSEASVSAGSPPLPLESDITSDENLIVASASGAIDDENGSAGNVPDGIGMENIPVEDEENVDDANVETVVVVIPADGPVAGSVADVQIPLDPAAPIAENLNSIQGVPARTCPICMDTLTDHVVAHTYETGEHAFCRHCLTSVSFFFIVFSSRTILHQLIYSVCVSPLSLLLHLLFFSGARNFTQGL